MAQIVADAARSSVSGLRRSVSERVVEKLEHNPSWPRKYKWPPHMQLSKNVSSKSFVSLAELEQDLHYERHSGKRLSNETGSSESEDHD